MMTISLYDSPDLGTVLPVTLLWLVFSFKIQWLSCDAFKLVAGIESKLQGLLLYLWWLRKDWLGLIIITACCISQFNACGWAQLLRLTNTLYVLWYIYNQLGWLGELAASQQQFAKFSKIQMMSEVSCCILICVGHAPYTWMGPGYHGDHGSWGHHMIGWHGLSANPW